MSLIDKHSVLLCLYTSLSVVCQTFLYGIFSTLVPFSIYSFSKLRSKSRANRFTFFMTLFMFTLSTLYWISSISNLIIDMKIDLYLYRLPTSLVATIFRFYPILNALITINLFLSDGVVVWRAWIICRHHRLKMLTVPVFLIVCLFICTVMTIGLRVRLSATKSLEAEMPETQRALEIFQTASLGLSLLTNITATASILIIFWQHMRENTPSVRQGRKSGKKVESIFLMLIESGSIYCISGMIMFIGSLVRLPSGTLGDVYLPIHSQAAGIYPTVVFLIVSRQRSFEGNSDISANSMSNVPNHTRNGRISTIRFTADMESVHEDSSVDSYAPRTKTEE